MKKYSMASLSGHQLILTWIMIPLFGIIMPLFFGCMITIPVLIGSAFPSDAPTWVIFTYCFFMGGIVFMVPIWFTVLFLHRPLRLQLTNKAIIVERYLSPYTILYEDIVNIQFPNKTIFNRGRWWGQWRHSGGLFGTFGIIKGKEGQDYHVFVTNDTKVVEINSVDGRQHFISPKNPDLFVQNLKQFVRE